MPTVATVDAKDKILMQLTHYLITVENYTPIVVRGVNNEIWLENLQAPYKIIRINCNYIHNNEQLDYDLLKIRSILRQVKRKTLSISMPTLNILLDVGFSVNMHNAKNIDCLGIDSTKNVDEADDLMALFPDLKNNLVPSEDSINFLIDVSTDINKKAERDNVEIENIFRKKPILVTQILIGLNILIYLIALIGSYTGKFDLLTQIALHRVHVQRGEIYRLITAAFAHEDIIHLFMNMYSLYIIGGQVETYLGKKKYILIYFLSAISGSLLSCTVNSGWSLGASGAIFGLMGTLFYFGYYYRLYLDNALRTQIVPLILLNLTIGFLFTNIDNAAHIGGLIGGICVTMALGINSNKIDRSDKKNGIICFVILLIALSLMLFLK